MLAHVAPSEAQARSGGSAAEGATQTASDPSVSEGGVSGAGAEASPQRAAAGPAHQWLQRHLAHVAPDVVEERVELVGVVRELGEVVRGVEP